jgi:hypothetical protein
MIRKTGTYTSMVAILAVLAALLALPAAPARAETFGGLGQVGSLVPEAPLGGGVGGDVAVGSAHGFAVNPQTGAYYIADRYETAGEGVPGFMVQEFSADGNLVNSKKLPAENADQIGGLAFSSATEKVYLLLLRKRPPKNEETKAEISDPNTQAAAVVYAFSAATFQTPAVIADEKALEPLGEGEAPLLDVHGIAVEGAGAHDLLLLGQQDVSKSKATTELRAAVQRVHLAGEPIGSRYFDSEDCLDDGHTSTEGCSEAKEQPSSPMVLPNQTLVAERGQALWSIPSPPQAGESVPTVSAATRVPVAPERVFTLPGLGHVITLESGKPEAGDQAALAVTGPQSARIYLAARTAVGAAATVVLSYQEPTYSELGWSGGGGTGACTAPTGPTDVLAGGTESTGFLFGAEPSRVAVMRFGPGGEICPHVTVGALSASVEGKEAMSVVAGEEVAVPSLKEVTFASSIAGANALFGKWTFQNLDRHSETPQTFHFQEGTIEGEKTFAEKETGRYLVTLEAQPDDFEPVQVRQLFVVVGMRVAFKSLRGANVGQAVPFKVKVVDPYEPSGPQLTYRWRFGDGTTLETKSTSTEPTFEHVFTRAGTYAPFLEVVDRTGHAAAAESTGVTISPVGSTPPPGSSGSKPVATTPGKPVFSTRLSSTSVRVRNGKVRLKLSCTAPTGFCKGRVVLKTVKRFRAHPHAKKRILTLAHAPFDIPAGHVATVVLHLTRKGRSLLSRKHTLQAAAHISTEQSSPPPLTTTTALTLKLARRR